MMDGGDREGARGEGSQNGHCADAFLDVPVWAVQGLDRIYFPVSPHPTKIRKEPGSLEATKLRGRAAREGIQIVRLG